MALADPADADGDGISGRARLVDDANGALALGRFGGKATAASLDMQTADAAAIDLGLSSVFVPLPHGDCTPAQKACRAMATGRSAAFENEEISREMIALVSAYVRSLEPGNGDPREAPPELFAEIGCAACHRPTMPDRAGKPLAVYTDLLLHDLGPEAAGSIPDRGVSPSEWRTAPLLDLDPMQGKRRYLHDGRAATIAEAIALHGGEADASRRAFLRLGAADRKRLVDFLSRR
jgi:CxxC motif-containing protein (DUF1111 family)